MYIYILYGYTQTVFTDFAGLYLSLAGHIVHHRESQYIQLIVII